LLRDSDKLSGFSIPGIKDKVLVTLFSDDTTIYLRESDRLADLNDILNLWCKASGATFNTEKTEIIPIGRLAHRQHVLSSRRLHVDDPPLPLSIHIAKDGEAIRSLGAWIGNLISNATPWEPIIDKIQLTLNRFQQSHPTLFAKCHMIQWTVGGMSQYLTKVQGMPKHIAQALEKLTRGFIWEDAAHPPIALAHLYKPRRQGGID
ncbi:hypothetical protein GLOTRDRAFT_28428, partial [Gloeophyllum trabeum ATCC 11539]